MQWTGQGRGGFKRVLGVVVLVFSVPLQGQERDREIVVPAAVPRPEFAAARATSPVSIDGRLDEAAWGQAPPIERFIQAQPETGAAATERTQVRVLYTDSHLYIGAMCFDRDPTAMIIKTIERDFPGVLSEDMDSFGMSFDTFLDRRNSFLFFVNPRGGIKDGQGFNDGTTRDYGWDGVVDVRTVVHDSGWTLEMAIPWKTLRYDPTRDPQSWGVNFLRRIRRRNEVSYWAPLDRRNRIFQMSRAGTLNDLPRVPRGRNLTVKPFVLAGRSTGDNLAVEDHGNEADIGLDVKYGITPRVTLDLTYRTDFSQADVDQEVVNLTRFPTFFPEKRGFFIENSGIFTLGDVTAPGAPRTGASLRDFTLFHTRTIGLNRGTPVPLLGGGRVTGRAESFEFGVIDVQSESVGSDPAENFSAARVRRNILGNSDVGILFTNRQATGDGVDGGYNRSLGADLNLRLGQSLFLNSYVALTRAPDAGDEAGRLSLGWRDRLWNLSAMVRHVGDDFDPGMGFVRRTGIRQWYATLGAHPRAPVTGVLEVNPYGEFDYITDLQGNRLTWQGTLGFDVTFDDGGRLNLAANDRRELLEDPFNVRPGVSIPIGDYHFREGAASYRTSEGRAVSGSVGVSGGGYFDGSRFTIDGRASWQPNYHVTFEASATHNSLSVQGADFTADLFAAQLKYAYSTTMYVGAFVQYNADTNQMVTNVRLQLIHAPLSDFFLVFTERRDLDGGVALERFLTAKVTKLFGF